MTCTVNHRGIIFGLDDYDWLGKPAMVDLVLTGMDVLITGGSTFPVRFKDDMARAWAYTTLHATRVNKGRFEIVRAPAAGRRFCRVIDCNIRYQEGYKKLWIQPVTRSTTL